MTKPKRCVLVVDDDQAMREMVLALLDDAGIQAEEAIGVNPALDLLRDRDFDAVLSDMRMPGRSGMELLGEIRDIRAEVPIILMTAFGSIDSAVEAIQAGAFDYITKPFKRDTLLVALERAFEKRRLEEENRRLRRALDRTSSFGELIGTSAPMREIFALLRKVADNRSSVLISGESGTGKELVARTLHFAGIRAPKPFVPINCTALPEGLMESELFGHVRGAFTGATQNKRGLFEEAEGGTLFLDEIGDMTIGLQSKLLRVLQEREVRPVGGNHSKPINVRVIAATNQDLRRAIEEGRFRKDLFYRLNVIPIEIPPLRDRPEDIPLLAEAFIRKHAEGRPFILGAAAEEKLRAGYWEGNARELENVIERAVALAESEHISPDDLPTITDEGQGRLNDDDVSELIDQALEQELTLSELEDLYTSRVLEKTRGNKARAAKILGINRRTLYRRGFAETKAG